MKNIIILLALLLTNNSLAICALGDKLRIKSISLIERANHKLQKMEKGQFFIENLSVPQPELVEIHIDKSKCKDKIISVNFYGLDTIYDIIETNTMPEAKVKSQKWKKLKAKKTYTTKREKSALVIGPINVHELYEQATKGGWLFKLKVVVRKQEYIIESPLEH